MLNICTGSIAARTGDVTTQCTISALWAGGSTGGEVKEEEEEGRECVCNGVSRTN